MKSTIKHLLILFTLLLTLVCITACGDDTPDVNTYLEPQADFFKVTWNSIEGATEYIVKINGKEYSTKEPVFLLYDHVFPGETKMIRVRAVVDGVTSVEDNWEQVEYTAESVTEGLVYTLLDDETYSVYCPSNAIPENGELVLPDTYDGEPVTIFRSEKSSSLGGLISPIAPNSTSNYKGPAYAGISKVRLPATLSKIETGALFQASITDIFLPDSVTWIGDFAFEGCKNLYKIRLSSKLERIGNFSFSDCTALTSIEIPDSVTTIEVGSFARTGLAEIELPAGVKHIAEYTFYDCAALSEIEYSENVAEIDNAAFHNTLWYNSQPDGFVYHKHFLYDYKGEMPANTSLTIPSHVKCIAGTGMFKDEPNLVAVTFPNGFKSIPVHTFFGCPNLKQVILPEGLISIGDGAFYGCPIEQITFPESLEFIGHTSGHVQQGAFENCTKLTSVTIPSSVRWMNARCFYGCTNLTTVSIEEGIEKIGEYVFSHCTSLNELVFPESVKMCYLTTVAYTGVTSLVWPKNPSFNGFYSLESGEGIPVTSLIIQKGSKNLDYYFFYRCDGLKTFYFMGTEQEWAEVEISRNPSGKFNYQPAAEAAAKKVLDAWESRLTVYFYSETEPTEEGNYWHYVDGLPVKW